MSGFIYEKYKNINAMHIPQTGLEKIWNNSWDKVAGQTYVILPAGPSSYQWAIWGAG